MKQVNIIKLEYPTLEDYINGEHNSIEFVNYGYADMNDDYTPYDLWELCNWKNWKSKMCVKPSNLHSGITAANSDVIFHEAESGKCYVPTASLRWLSFSNIKDAKENLIERALDVAWYHDIDRYDKRVRLCRDAMIFNNRIRRFTQSNKEIDWQFPTPAASSDKRLFSEADIIDAFTKGASVAYQSLTYEVLYKQLIQTKR